MGGDSLGPEEKHVSKRQLLAQITGTYGLSNGPWWHFCLFSVNLG